MPTLRVDRSLRVGSGLGLLLLLTAQGNVCPWVGTAAAQSATPAGRTNAPEPQKNDASKKRKAPLLPYLVPDAVAPRWPAAWTQATLRQTTGWHDGVVSCGRRSPATDDTAAGHAPPADRWAWHRFLEPAEPSGIPAPLVLTTNPLNPAVRTTICPTGPPRA